MRYLDSGVESKRDVFWGEKILNTGGACAICPELPLSFEAGTIIPEFADQG